MEAGKVTLGDFTFPVTPANVIASLYDLAALSPEEQKIMELICLCWPSPIHSEDFLRWSGLGTLWRVDALCDKGWLERDVHADTYSVNPIVNKSVQFLHPTPLSKHTDFLLNLSKDLSCQDQMTWRADLKQYYARLILHILAHKGEITEQLLPFYLAAERLLVYGGLRDQSSSLNEELDAFLAGKNRPFELSVVRYRRGWTLITQWRKPAAGLQLMLKTEPMMEQSVNPDDSEQRSCQIGRARVGKECRSRWSPYH